MLGLRNRFAIWTFLCNLLTTLLPTTALCKTVVGRKKGVELLNRNRFSEHSTVSQHFTPTDDRRQRTVFHIPQPNYHQTTSCLRKYSRTYDRNKRSMTKNRMATPVVEQVTALGGSLVQKV